VRYEGRYDSFRTKLQGKGFDGQFDSIFTETVENAGGRASSELLDMAIKLLVEGNKPTPTQAHDAFEELYFQPRKESGHQFYIKFDEYARRAIDGRPEAYQKAHLATLGKTLRSEVLKGLKEDGNEQKISEFELRFSNLRTEQDSTQSVAAIVKELFPSLPTLTPSSTFVEEAETHAGGFGAGCFKCGGPHYKRDCSVGKSQQPPEVPVAPANDKDNEDYKKAMKILREAGING
jgi:hypothetical protein